MPMGNIRSRDLSFPETFVPRTFRSWELSFRGPFVSRNSRSQGTFVPEIDFSLDLSPILRHKMYDRGTAPVPGCYLLGRNAGKGAHVLGTKVPGNKSSWRQTFPI